MVTSRWYRIRKTEQESVCPECGTPRCINDRAWELCRVNETSPNEILEAVEAGLCSETCAKFYAEEHAMDWAGREP